MQKSIIFFILTLLSFFLGHVLGRGMILLVVFPFIFWIFAIYYATKEKETTKDALKTWVLYHIILLVISEITLFLIVANLVKGGRDPHSIAAVALLFGIFIILGVIVGFAAITLIIVLSRKRISEINLKRKNLGKKSIALRSFYISLIAVTIIEIIFMLINYNNTVKNFNHFIDDIRNGLYYPQAFNNVFYFFQELAGGFLISFVIVIFVHYIVSYIFYKKS